MITTHESPSRGTLLWITASPPGERKEIATAGRELGLGVRFCRPGEVFAGARTEGCSVIAVEVAADATPALALLKDLARRLPRATLMAAASDTSAALMRAALEAGASEFLSLPVSPQELEKALIKCAHTSRGAGTAGDVIAVCGARGGLGATTLAVNLACRLAERSGFEVALVDLDLQRGDVVAFLNLTPVESLATVGKARGQVDEAFLRAILLRHSSGVFVLPAPLEIEEADAIGHDEVDLAVRLLRAQFRYTVIDTARAITGATLAAWEQSDRILLLTDLSVPGVRSARRALELAGRLNVPPQRLEVVVTGGAQGALSLRDAVRALGKEPYFTVPYDAASAAGAMNDGTPLNGKPAPLAIALDEFAAKLAGKDPLRRTGHLLRRLFAKTQGGTR